jgi:hypothetical protein
MRDAWALPLLLKFDELLRSQPLVAKVLGII